ncbi:nucleoside hydrolase [uncultured Clostridium sp.]|uniref:nucleoside hydrolase n=1 Tax=uncultured Clostridium sp. TaxID=59620 RepID=UPI0025E89DDF|nr:nucleoside hydrolase [uncultured Clostridium sp.]
MEKKIPVIIDCDPGVDDALAIILALSHPSLDVRAVCSVTGNGNIENTTDNGLKILSLCGREDIPLYRGSDTALNRERPETVDAFGDDGLGGYAHTVVTDKKPESEHAVDYLLRAVREAPGELTILAIGPCTNLARAVIKEPWFAENVKRLIIMGGAKYTGNMSPVAEYNFWADPEAAAVIFRAGFKERVMIGLDVTNKIALDAGTRELLRIFGTDLSRFLYHITQSGLDENWLTRRKPVSPMHDVLTAAYLIDPDVITVKPAFIDVVTEGISRGQSVVDIDGHWNHGTCNALYADSVDVNRFYRLLLTTVFKEHEEEILAYLGSL